MDWSASIKSEIHKVTHTGLDNSNVELCLLREDLIHPQVSGNKWRKLKYHVLKAQEAGLDTLVTYGGAFSNHIAATAAAAHESGLHSIGIIRGDEFKSDNPTLSQAAELGMELRFVSRTRYRDDKELIIKEFGFGQSTLVIPEGGAGELGVRGCEEIMAECDDSFDFVCCSAGTGTTAAGILRSIESPTVLKVYSALKGDFLKAEILSLTNKPGRDFYLSDEHSFGGYARTSEVLFNFIIDFYAQTGIRLDPIYTGKMMYGIMKEIENGLFADGARILAIHTGGLQGVRGIELRDKVTLFTD